MNTTSLTQQILVAVENDPAAIRALADAVARGDASAIRGTLGACGVELSAGEADALLNTARSSVGRAFT